MPSRSAQRGAEEWEGRFGLLPWVITKELVASSSPSWAQRTSCGYPRCRAREGTKTTAAQKCKTVARQSVQTKRLVGDTVISGRRGSQGASAQHCSLRREQPSQKWCRRALLCTFGDEVHYCDASEAPALLSCFRRLCMSESFLCHLWNVPVPESHLSGISLTATFCCLP